VKYQFIAEHCGEYPVTLMCHVLEISVSGYYAWHKREPSQHSREDAALAAKVEMAFEDNRGVYGSPRIHAELQAQGIRCGQKRVARLMRELDISAQRPKHRTITTHSEKGAPVAANLLQQDFHADRPNQKWTTDTTYIWTQEGWLYLAVVLDVFSRMVVGWSMATIQDAILVQEALQMAIARRCPGVQLLHHSDRGSTYTCESYLKMLQEHGMVSSMSRTANCYDNAMTESFFHSFKGECVDRQVFQTRVQARRATFDYLECFYNRTRRHSTLQYMSPAMFEQVMC
jgi:putative transposase